MPIYAFSDLDGALSPELRRRKQGKSCFNFTTVDEPLLAELATLIAAGFERYLALAAQTPVRSAAARLTAALDRLVGVAHLVVGRIHVSKCRDAFKVRSETVIRRSQPDARLA